MQVDELVAWGSNGDIERISQQRSKSLIRKAYKEMSRKVHPDKNKGIRMQPKNSIEYGGCMKFQAKEAFDNVIKARKARKHRDEKMDVSKKRMKDDVEERERTLAVASHTGFES